ncbi:MAG: hypothetical protein ACRDJM_06225 [Actinomycetota bacterium]
MSVSTPSGGAGTTLVLGTRFVQGLANTGVAAGKLVWMMAAGTAGIVAGAAMLGRGHRVPAGEVLENGPTA